MNNLRYVFMVLLGGALYGTMSSCVKLSYAEQFTAAELSFFQAAIAAGLLAACNLLRRGHKVTVSPTDRLHLLLTGGAIGMTNLLYYRSVAYIPASLAIVVLMQFTWFALLVEWLVSHRRPKTAEMAAAATILVGTVMAGNLSGVQSMRVAPLGLGCALSASLTYAVYVVANSHVAKHLAWQSKSMWIMVGSSLSIFLTNGRTIIWDSHLSVALLRWTLLLAVAGTAVPTALFSAGIARIGATLSAVLMTIELPVAVVCARILLGETIRPLQIAGVVVMLCAMAALNYYKHQRDRERVG